jgi:hypothetical protein
MDRILPNILATFTGKRYKPTIEFVSGNWTHNLFRLYELIFWRRVGIRCEVTADSDGNYTFHTIEARVAHFEGFVRKMLAGIHPFPAKYPEMAWQRGAIAYLTSGIQSTASSAPAVSLTISGSDRILIFAPDYGTSDSVTGTTWNTSENGTFLQKIQGSGVNWEYLYYLTNPTATTANAVANASGSDARLIASAYTGASGIDTSTTDTQTNATTFTINVTTGVANAFIVAAVANNSGDANQSSDGNVRQSAGTGRSYVDKFCASSGANSVDTTGT